MNKKRPSVSMSRAAFSIMLSCWCVHVSAASWTLATQRGPAFSASDGGDGDSAAPIVSANGRYVLFASSADNLVLNNSSNAIVGPLAPKLNVFLRDRTNGTTSLVSLDYSGAGGGNGDSIPIEISIDGRLILFESSASNLVPGDTNNAADVFVRDLTTATNLLVSTSTTGGVGNGGSRGSVMSPDGRSVAFVSAASNLVANDTNGIPDVFVRDLQNNVTLLASTGARTTGTGSGSEAPMMTPDGRYVAFYSTATNLVAGVATRREIYVRDLVGATTILASTNAQTTAAEVVGTTNLAFYDHNISDDGQYVAFQASSADSNSKAYKAISRPS